MSKKALAVWIISTVTFIALLHLIDAITALITNSPTKLLQLYPFINDKLQTITPQTYLWISATATFILWGIACVIAFENPVETFLNKILSDAKRQSTVETQLLEDKSEVIDVMIETLEANSETLAQVKDSVTNVRAEVKDIKTLGEHLEKIKTELTSLKKEVKKIDEKAKFPNICPSCGKPLMPEFNLCPYCGENIKLLQSPIVNLKNYK